MVNLGASQSVLRRYAHLQDVAAPQQLQTVVKDQIQHLGVVFHMIPYSSVSFPRSPSEIEKTPSLFRKFHFFYPTSRLKHRQCALWDIGYLSWGFYECLGSFKPEAPAHSIHLVFNSVPAYCLRPYDIATWSLKVLLLEPSTLSLHML